MQLTLLTTATCKQSYISKISTPKAKENQNNAGNSMFRENNELCCLTIDFMRNLYIFLLTATPPSVSSSSSNNIVPQ